MKTEILKAMGFALIGAWLALRFQPEPKLPEVKVTQQQAAKCKAVVKKETKPDGTKTEEVVFESDMSQEQEVVILPKTDPYKIYLGLGTDKKAQASVSKGNQLHQLKSDGNKDHVYYFNYKVAEIDF